LLTRIRWNNSTPDNHSGKSPRNDQRANGRAVLGRTRQLRAAGGR
jgi:hypothetical protein